SPDGGRIAYLASRELTPEQEKKEKAKDDAQVVDQDFRYSELWTIDDKTKKATSAVRGDFQVIEARWSPDGSRIAYTAVPTPKADDGSRSDIWIVTLASG